MRGRGLPTGVLMATLTALLLAGCGGSDQGGSTSGQSGAAPAPAGNQQTKPTGAGQETSGAGSGDTGRKRESHFEGGEEEVEEFGSEAQGSAKDEVLATERSYLSAIATKGYEQACARLAPAVTRLPPEDGEGERRRLRRDSPEIAVADRRGCRPATVAG